MVANMMKYCASSLLLMYFLATPVSWAQELSDPTRPPSGLIEGSAQSSSISAHYPQVRGLQSVIISATHCAAIIDGKTVELGAKHGVERLIEINERGVLLQGGSGSRSLLLFPAVGMKAAAIKSTDKQAVTCKVEQISNIKNPAKQAGLKEKK